MTIFDSLKNLFGFTPPQPDHLVPDPTTAVPQPLPSGLPPAAERRNQLMQFLVSTLRPYQNESVGAPSALKLSVVCTDADEENLYRVALWEGQPGKFQAELNRQLVDNYIRLPKNWQFAYVLSAEPLPGCTYRDGVLGVIVGEESTAGEPPRPARLTALTGQTARQQYRLDPMQKTSFCIGRGHSTPTTSGRVRTNDVVFLNDDEAGFDAGLGAGNGAVSRAHATIRYDARQRHYVLLVDPGGLPASGNKTKILHPDDRMERADIAGMSYPLQDGDQIELGGAVTLLFELPAD